MMMPVTFVFYLRIQIAVRNAAARFAFYAFVLTVSPAVGAMRELERRRLSTNPIVVLLDGSRKRSRGLLRVGIETTSTWSYCELPRRLEEVLQCP